MMKIILTVIAFLISLSINAQTDSIGYASPEAINNAKVLWTMFRGKIVYTKE